MFSDDLRQELEQGKYTRWVAHLTEEQLVAALWVVGEYGLRAHDVLDCLDRHRSEFPPQAEFARARLALGLLSRMFDGEKFGFEEIADQVRAVKERLEAGGS